MAKIPKAPTGLDMLRFGRRGIEASRSPVTGSIAAPGLQAAIYAPGTIGANLSGGILTIGGSGFGTKPTASPLFYNDFEAITDGTAAISAGIGMSDLASSDGTADQVKISTSRSHSGTKALRCIYPTSTNSMFPQVGVIVSPGSDRIYMGQWVYYEHTTGSTISPIFKWCRAGSSNGGAYHGTPRFYETVRPNAAATDVGCDMGYVNNDFGTYYGKPWHSGYTQKALGGTWNFIEYVYLLHPTAGIFQQKVKGVDNIAGAVYSGSDVAQTYGKTADAANNATVDWAISVFDGNDSYGNTNAWTLWCDEMYVDRSLARVIVTNNATYTSSTEFSVQPPTSWSDASIACTFKQGALTAGTRYAHVWKHDNTYVGNFPFTVP